MRIGIDARMMGKGYGIGRYIEQLVFWLPRIDTGNEYVVFAGERPEHAPDNVSYRLTDIPWYSLREQIQLSAMLKKARLDLVHFPHWNVPVFYHDPFVVTIHDLTMYHYPRPEATTLGPIRYRLKDTAHRMAVRHAVETAKHILVTSEWTANDLHATLGVQAKKMTVTYQAPFDSRLREKTLSTVDLRSAYGINKPYVLYVGAAYPHKNLEILITAWQHFQKKFGTEYQLVLVGKEDYFYKKLKEHFQIGISFQDRGAHDIRFVGFVPDDHLNHIYQHAAAFVFPSLYEGFGLPPLEALAHGVPVVSSDRSCLPEILGDAAVFVDPEDVTMMADALRKVLTDRRLRAELIEKGIARAAAYSWQGLARKTCAVYQQAYI